MIWDGVKMGFSIRFAYLYLLTQIARIITDFIICSLGFGICG